MAQSDNLNQIAERFFFHHRGVAAAWDRNRGLFLWILLCTTALGLFAHGYCFGNTLFSHDSLYSVSQQGDLAYKISLGRFAQVLNIKFRGTIVAPWLIGMLALVWLTLSNFFIVKLFDIRKKHLQGLVCGLTVLNVAFTLTNATYIHESDSFMLALLCSVMAVYLLRRFAWGFVVAPVLLGLGCGFYQSYFGVAVALCMLLLIQDLLEGDNWKNVLPRGICFVAVLVAGLVCYLVMFKIVLWWTGIVPLDSYNGMTGLLDFSAYPIPDLIMDSYGFFFAQFLTPSTYLGDKILLANGVILLITFGLMAEKALRKNLSFQSAALIDLILILLPFGTGIIFFIAKGETHTLMTFAFPLVYLLPILLMDETVADMGASKALLLQWSRGLVVIALGTLLFSNAIYANQVYLEKELVYQSTLSTMTRVVDEMEHTEGYVLGETPVVFIGNLGNTGVNRTRSDFGHLDDTGLYSNLSVTYDLSSYFNYILSYPIHFGWDQSASISAMEEVAAMPSFPHVGYCAMMDGCLVVKLSE